MVITFHFTDDKQDLSDEETLEMIENHKYLMDCIYDLEVYMVGGTIVEQMTDSISNPSGVDSFFL